jgi:DNA polymerase III subunit epsilon
MRSVPAPTDPKPARASPVDGLLWDAPLGTVALAFVDLEMTGLDREQDRVVEICIERTVAEQTVARLHTLVRTPDVEPPAAAPEASGAATAGVKASSQMRAVAQAMHGISAADRAHSPSFGELAADVAGMLNQAVLVAHAAAHDVAFLEQEFRRAGRDWACPHFVDTLPLVRRALALPRAGLVAAAARLGIPNPRPHRADNDVAVLRGLWQRLIEQLSPRTARDLWNLQAGFKPDLASVLALAEQARERGKPVWISYRCARRPVERLAFRVTEIRTDLDPPRVLGYLELSRGRRELHGDRILAIELSDG